MADWWPPPGGQGKMRGIAGSWLARKIFARRYGSTMTKSMPLSDFRAVRKLLEPDEWGLPGEETPPTDMIKPEIWHGIVDLPGDVAISTSDHNGKKLKYLY